MCNLSEPVLLPKAVTIERFWTKASPMTVTDYVRDTVTIMTDSHITPYSDSFITETVSAIGGTGTVVEEWGLGDRAGYPGGSSSARAGGPLGGIFGPRNPNRCEMQKSG